MDYPDIAAAVGQAVARKEADAGIVIDGAGIGSAIAANKIRGVRAAMCLDETTARYSREHNGANVLALGATLLPGTDAAHSDRRSVARHADARGALHQAPDENPPAGRTPVNPQDLQRLVEIITEELLAAQGPGGRADPLQLSRGAIGLLSDTPARRARCRRDASRPARGRRRAGRRVRDDRPHAAQGRRDARRDREALPRGGRVPVRHCVRQPGVGRARRLPAARHRRRRLLGRRVSPRRDDRRREELRDAARDLRRRRRRSTW